MTKDFDGWNALKKRLNADGNFPPHWKEREIWWGCIGVNIGHEQDGKNAEYNRPVLVVKKFNRRLFWGVPLTTQVKDNSHYHRFAFKGREQCAMLTQMRLFDASRITTKMGRMEEKEFRNIKLRLLSYLK